MLTGTDTASARGAAVTYRCAKDFDISTMMCFVNILVIWGIDLSPGAALWHLLNQFKPSYIREWPGKLRRTIHVKVFVLCRREIRNYNHRLSMIELVSKVACTYHK